VGVNGQRKDWLGAESDQWDLLRRLARWVGDWGKGRRLLASVPSWARGCGWLIGQIGLTLSASEEKEGFDFSLFNF
jgi:hypothetical protein